jgi:hypothetical protein
MKNRIKIAICSILFFNICWLHAQRINDYNVVWNTPSQNSGGSMPLGNGELGMNAWVEESGDLLFYLSRTDAISEWERLMKLGRIRVALSPNPFEKGNPFVQTLLLNDGVIEIKAGKEGQQTVIRLFLDTSYNVAYMTFESELPRKITVTAESWRRQPHIITKEEAHSAYIINDFPQGYVFEESADIFLPDKNAVAWCHYNKGSQLFDLTMHHQDLSEYAKNFPDPVSNRIFGVYMTGKDFIKMSDSTFSTKGTVKQASLKITTHSQQVSSIDEWSKQIQAIDRKSNLQTALNNSKKWWSEFWNRSYIYIDIPDDKEFGYKLTQSYILQRYIAAGSGRGTFPIKSPGSIFTTDPQYVNKKSVFNPDYRLWGNEFWWQNTRLPYFAMLTSGDFNLMHSIFDFYLNRMDAFKVLANKFYGAKGIFIPETVTLFGTYANPDYGWDRTGVSSNEVTNPFIRHIWSEGLEFSKLMLDYYYYTGDSIFLKQKALPAIKDVLLYFDSRFVQGQNKMKISPTQALETYWYDVVNDMPSVAGLHYLLDALDRLPDGIVSEEDKTFYTQLKKTLPDLPQKNTAEGNVFLPAEEYLSHTENWENPELYIVWPFGLANFTNEWKDVGIRTFNRRNVKQYNGWAQDGQEAAMLGLKDILPEILKEKIANTNVNQRFLAMWGPNYDWTPDQDHGSNLLLTLQYMLLQTYNGEPHVLPAWPENWNVSFKLWAPNQKVVEGEYKDGKLQLK